MRESRIIHSLCGAAALKKVVFAAAFVVALALPMVALADGPQQDPPRPKLQPGWAATGTLHIVGPTVNAASPAASKVVEGPFGPITVTTRFAASAQTAGTSGVLSGGSGTCVSTYSQPSYRFTIYTPWQWDYNSVTWMGSTTYSLYSIPLWFWNNTQTWNDWGQGWQYAWGNGRSTLNYGVLGQGAAVASVHNNALVDAWGNCTPQQWFNWF